MAEAKKHSRKYQETLVWRDKCYHSRFDRTGFVHSFAGSNLERGKEHPSGYLDARRGGSKPNELQEPANESDLS